MELKLMYLILAGWAVMLLVPSILPAFIIAGALGGAGVYIAFLDQAPNGRPMAPHPSAVALGDNCHFRGLACGCSLSMDAAATSGISLAT